MQNNGKIIWEINVVKQRIDCFPSDFRIILPLFQSFQHIGRNAFLPCFLYTSQLIFSNGSEFCLKFGQDTVCLWIGVDRLLQDVRKII